MRQTTRGQGSLARFRSTGLEWLQGLAEPRYKEESRVVRDRRPSTPISSPAPAHFTLELVSASQVVGERVQVEWGRTSGQNRGKIRYLQHLCFV
jgi:hypothetical protein